MRRFLLFFVAAVLLAACDNKFEVEGNAIQNDSTLPTLTAEFADEDTRTYVEDNTYLRWHEGDLISAFIGNTCNSKYVFVGKTGDNSGTFDPSDSNLGSGNKLNRNYALYPCDKSAEISTNGVVNCILPAIQEYKDNSFGKDANTMVAVTKDVDDTFLAFKNVCGYLKVKFYGEATIKNIEFKGNNGEKIAGAATIMATYGDKPVVAMADDATESITLDCSEGISLSADAKKPTEFWFVVPPTEFSNGVTIVATDTNGFTFEKSSSNTVAITRNEIQPMAAVEAIFRDPTKPANNEIWYTSSDGEIVEPNNSDVFGANIVSNTYKNNKGVITFDEDVTTIGMYAFNGCSKLTSITIPNSVTTIQEYAFGNCNSLKEFKGKFAANNGRCLIVNGVLTSFAPYGISEYTIPDGVTKIGDYAFYKYNSLTSVTIPDSVKKIGDYAFYKCNGLKSLTIGCGATWYGWSTFAEITGKLTINCNIPDRAFQKTNITDLVIGEKVTSIGEVAFSGCAELKSLNIPDNVDTIRGHAFSGCSNLQDITIGSGVTSFGSDVFYKFAGKLVIKCNVSNSLFKGTDVTSVTIEGSASKIGDEAFANCSSLKNLTIENGVTEIDSSAFSRCKLLTDVTIPNSVKTIGRNAFEYCSSLQNVIIGSGVTSFGYAFSGFTGKLTINSNIPKEAFKDTGITSLVIGDNVTSIGVSAFRNCTKLTNIDIPDNVKTIDSYAFCGCSNLQNVTIGNGIKSFGSDVFSGFAGKLTINSNIPKEAFQDTDITSLVIGNKVTSIGWSAFRGCAKLTDLNIPDNVKTIDSNAFYGCSSLQNITIGSGVTSFGSDVFYGSAGKLTINCNIPDSAFQKTNITNLVIGNKVTSIGDSAFQSCTSLTSVTISDSVTTIGRSAFYGCDALTSTTIGKGVTSFGQSAFSNCTGTLTINCNIPDKTRIISLSPFESGLFTSVVIGENVTKIGDGAFVRCEKLKDVTIGNSVTEIGYGAFAYCTSLTSITIPKNVKKIYGYAFGDCSKLTSVNCKSSTPPTAIMSSSSSYWNAFDNNASNRKIYVPSGSANKYKKANGWDEYEKYIE